MWQARDGIRSVWPHRCGAGAPVYLAACLEYITAELVELGGSEAKKDGSDWILPVHIKRAIENDEELCKLFDGVTFADLAPPSATLCAPQQNYCTKEDALPAAATGTLPPSAVQSLWQSLPKLRPKAEHGGGPKAEVVAERCIDEVEGDT